MTSVGFAQGTYVGNGVTAGDQKAITGLGFSPKVVVVKADTATNGTPMVRTITMSSARNVSSPTTDAGIASLDLDGFTVQKVDSAQGRTNENGVTYYWYALGGANCLAGTYVGDGVVGGQGITGLGFQPVLVTVLTPSTGNWPVYRTTTMGTEAYEFGLSAGNVALVSLDADGFTVKSDINGNGTTYHYFAIAPSDNFAEGTYTGNGTDNRNLPSPVMSFNPTFAQTKADNAGYATWKVAAMVGDKAANYASSATSANWIQAFGTGTFQVGGNVMAVNYSTVIYYWFAIAGYVPVSGVGVSVRREGTAGGRHLPFEPRTLELRTLQPMELRRRELPPRRQL